jgi:hypothetical protein
MNRDTLPAPAFDPIPAESITADERRQWLEALASGSDSDNELVTPTVLASVGLSAVDPPGERFEGECTALAAILADQADRCLFAMRVLAWAALEVWRTAHDGTAASRGALLRAVGAFLLHGAANRGVLAAHASAVGSP